MNVLLSKHGVPTLVALLMLLLALSACTGRISLAAELSNPGEPAAPAEVLPANTLQPTESPTATTSPSATPTETITLTPTPSATATPSPTLTSTPPPTRTSTTTLTPTVTETPTITPSPTPDFPEALVKEQANCRYGPGTAYLYAHGMYAGDQSEIHGRNYSGNWLWIKPENLERHCWASASVLDIHGDPSTVPVAHTKLPKSTLYGPPQSVSAERDGSRVVVSWEAVWMTEDDDRGYMIEATICQNGIQIGVAVHTDSPSYEFVDDENCSGDSGGRLYTVEKHGYTEPVSIPWP